jgi:phosphatidylinositol glycan class S
MSTSAQAPVLTEAAGAKANGKDVKETAPPNAVDVAYKKKEPPPESAESIRLRAWVIASFWIIVIAVGLPIWWKTTAIYRANLPLDQMMDWADGRVWILFTDMRHCHC